MNKTIKVIIATIFLLILTLAVTASSSTQTMLWKIPFDTNERTVWLNWTQEEYGWEVPKQICFGLNDTSVCLGGDRANVDMYQMNITNITLVNTTFVEAVNITADNYCYNNGTCLNLSQIADGGGSATNGFTVHNDGPSKTYFSFTTT